MGGLCLPHPVIRKPMADLLVWSVFRLTLCGSNLPGSVHAGGKGRRI